MLDTAKLTAAVAVLHEYCEQARHVMVARGHPEATVYVTAVARCESGLSHVVWLHWDGKIDDVECEPFRGLDCFTDALAFAESMPPAHTPDNFAAAIGIAPDGSLLDDDEICCPVGDPECTAGEGQCHDACEAPALAAMEG